jgi:hypothetical protein
MKKKITSCLFVLFIVCVSFAQDFVSTRDKYPEMKYLGLSGTLYYNSYYQVKGSAYLADNWTKGTIFLTNGIALKDVNFKIDLFTQQVLIYHDILKRVITIDNNNFGHLAFNENGHERMFKKVKGLRTQSAAIDGIIVEALTEGNIAFYKVYYKNKISLLEPVKPYIYEFTNSTRYFILKDADYLPVKCGRRNLIKIFPEYKAVIKQYIRQSHLKLKKEGDFSKAVGYINNLKN